MAVLLGSFDKKFFGHIAWAVHVVSLQRELVAY